MNQLIEKMRRAREKGVEIGGHKFTIRRPTHLEAAEGGLNGVRGAARFVVGWDLKESDLIPGGTATPVEYDRELFVEWVEDQPMVWGKLIEELTDAYKAHAEKLETEQGN